MTKSPSSTPASGATAGQSDSDRKTPERPRKVIGLMPVKNESWILKTTIPEIQKYCDEILALDGGSTDDTAALLKGMGVLVEPQVGQQDQYSSWRQYLLDWGRKRGGTHFVWLDADEAFTSHFKNRFSDVLDRMKPGQKVLLDWLCLWKDPYSLRSDESVWAKNYKDFIYYDDGVSQFDDTRLHESRTPGDYAPERLIRIARSEGAVLHFQCAAFSRFQIKQAYQRCRELFLATGPAWQINQKYAITLDEPLVRCEPVPRAWLAGFTHLDSIRQVGYDWFYAAILEYFEKKGIAFYEPLEIWQIPELKALFLSRLNREPVVQRDEKFRALTYRKTKRLVARLLPAPVKNWLKARL